VCAVFLEDAEFLFGIAQLDRALKSEVSEGVDEVPFFVFAAFALIGVDGKFEG
jgi:hypothetical protein